jgi:uncharacterized protein (DUF362 family)
MWGFFQATLAVNAVFAVDYAATSIIRTDCVRTAERSLVRNEIPRKTTVKDFVLERKNQ